MKPTHKAREISQFLEAISGRNSAINSNMCVRKPIGCGKPISAFRDLDSEREYSISGLCQKCQDKTFGVK